jgi:hypothetical protein
VPPSRYRTAAQRFVRKHLADLPEDRRGELVDALEAVIRTNDRASYQNIAATKRPYMREYMRRRRSDGQK